MMGIVVPETCWAYKKYNEIISGIYLVFILQLPIQVIYFLPDMLYTYKCVNAL
jgi:hypothetical protein